MKEEILKRLLDLVEKTGDKMIVTDPAGERPYILMGLGQYENLVLGERPPQKNAESKREIPLWKPQVSPPPAPLVSQKPAPVRNPGGPPPARPAPLRQVPPMPNGPNAAPAAHPATEAVIEAEGEEQFYLEPLE
jgi:hypothetical protein